MLRTLRVAILSLVALTLLLLGVVVAARYAPDSWVGRLFAGIAAPNDGEVAPQLARLSIGGPYTLVDPAGHTVTENSFGGRWQLIYFGYTNCPDLCPTTLQTIAAALRGLGPLAARVAPLFITIDPARDTRAVMARYTGLFDPRIIGLTGTERQVRAAEHSFRVYAAPAARSGGMYLMDHSSFIYLMNPRGELEALFDRNVTPTALDQKLRQALG